MAVERPDYIWEVIPTRRDIAHHIESKPMVFSPGYAEVAEWQTRCVQGAVSLADVGVQISPSAPLSIGLVLGPKISVMLRKRDHQ